MDDAVDPFGRTSRRSQRLSDEETSRRMLETGVQMVNDSGLQLSFDLLRLEEVIDAANVSRSAVYRKWPTKAHYFADLLLELAGQTHPATAAYSISTVETACDVAEAFIDVLRTPAGRRQIAVEMCRQGALENFETLRGLRKKDAEREWSTYVALQATLLSLPAELELEARMRAVLRTSEERFIEKMAAFYSNMVEVVGFKVRDIATLNFGTIATLGAAVVEGLAINAIVVPEIAQQRYEADPFNTGLPAEWSMPALGFTSIVMSLVEPVQPDQEWGNDRIEISRVKLREIRNSTPA